MKTLLIINDDPLLLDTVAEIFELEGYRVLRAPTGIEGLGIALHEQPNGIVCDLAMSGLGGYAVYDILRADQKTANIPFILMTDWSGSLETVNFPQLPSDQVIPKPFPVEHLLTVVSQLTQRAVA